MVNKYHDIHEAYLGTLKTIWYSYEERSAPRNQPIREILNHYFEVKNPTSDPIVTLDHERNNTIETYTNKEFELYNSGTNKVEHFAKASKFWEKIANPDGTVNSAYGHLIWNNPSMGNAKFAGSPLSWSDKLGLSKPDPEYVTPWQWCVDSLKSDKDTRQAIMKFMLPEHLYKGNKDVTCTTHGTWNIRRNKLNLSIVMRSNDIVKGLAYDLPWFCSLMDKMLDELRETYPDLEKGTYSHFVHSMHAYERDEKTILSMLGRS
jgi:thymidylate synthase